MRPVKLRLCQQIIQLRATIGRLKIQAQHRLPLAQRLIPSWRRRFGGVSVGGSTLVTSAPSLVSRAAATGPGTFSARLTIFTPCKSVESAFESILRSNAKSKL